MSMPAKAPAFEVREPMRSRWLYYRRLASLYLSYRRRAPLVAAPPLRLWLEISSRCNLKCAVCPNQELPEARKGDMAWPLFSGLVDQAGAFALEINLHHRGESLLHPEAGRFIRHAAASGVPCRLHTNATLLRGPVVDDLLASGLQRLSVSFDGFHAAAYEAVRRGARFEQVLDNIAAFLRRRGRGRPSLAVEVMDLPGAGDRRQRSEFAARLRAMGADKLVFKKPHNWAGHLSSPAGAGAGIPPGAACTFPWNALVVLHDGTVLPCSQDFFATLPLGDAREKPLLEIWNGPALRELRRAFAAGAAGRLAACSGCDRIRRPTRAGVPAEYLKKLLFRRMT